MHLHLYSEDKFLKEDFVAKRDKESGAEDAT
jgi:hypothetical protein